MKRRALLKGGLAAGAVLTMPNVGIRLASAAEPVHIYSLKSLTGAYATYGKFANMGCKLAIKHYGEVLGRNIAYHVINTESSPSVAVRKVQEAVQQENAQLFCGCSVSSVGLAVGKTIDQSGGIFMTPCAADELTGSECNAATFKWTVPTYGAMRETIIPLIKKKPDAKRWYTITPDYVFGKAMLQNSKDIFEEYGIEHVGNSYHPMATQQFSGYLANAMAANPDVLLLLNFAGDSTRCIRQAVNFGLKNKMTILLAWSSGLTQFQTLGPHVLDGIYIGAQYWHEVDTPMNRLLVKRTDKAYGMNPPYPLAGGYTITRIILDAIANAGTSEAGDVRKAMEGMTYQGLSGTEKIQASNHQVIKDYYFMRGKAESEMKNEADYADIISSGKSFLPESSDMCKMA